MRLKHEHHEHLREQGFVIVRGLFEPSDLQPVRDELADGIDRRARELLAQGEITELHEDASFETRFGLLMQQSEDIQARFGEAMFRQLRHPKLMEALESLIGGEISCSPIQHLRAKPPACQGSQSFFNVPWHQDAAVTVEEADDVPLYTCWYPLGDATEEMGCMRLLPGVHKQGYLKHVKSDYGTTVDPALMPTVEPVIAECQQGDVIIMNSLTPHHSTPNRSDRCRWTLDLRYFPTGQCSGRPWQPDFPVHAADPARVLTDHAEWCRLWREALANPAPRAQHRIADPVSG